MIDGLRKQIQQRLDQLTGEADKLRKALAELDPRTTGRRSRSTPSRASSTPAASKRAAPPRSGGSARRSGGRTSRPSTRSTPGATRSSVLAALSDGQALTAGEVAAKTGLGRATVSTTLSRLAKSGEVQKAERGYRRTPKSSAADRSTPTPAR